MTTDDRANIEALPAFDDPRVQIVYRILCDTDLVPPPDEHWEGFTARHVVAALASAQAASAEQVAPCAASCLAAGGGTQDDYCNLTQGECARKLTTPAPAASAEPVVDARSLNWTQAAPKTMLSPDHWQEAFYEDAGAVLYFRAANEDVPHAQRIINLLATPAPAVAPAVVTEALRKLVEMARTSGDDAEPDAELMAACDEASDILATLTPEPAAVTDEMQSEFEPDEAVVQALRVAIEGECDGLDITDAQARAVLRYVGATIKYALTKTIRSRTRTPDVKGE